MEDQRARVWYSQIVQRIGWLNSRIPKEVARPEAPASTRRSFFFMNFVWRKFRKKWDFSSNSPFFEHMLMKFTRNYFTKVQEKKCKKKQGREIVLSIAICRQCSFKHRQDSLFRKYVLLRKNLPRYYFMLILRLDSLFWAQECICIDRLGSWMSSCWRSEERTWWRYLSKSTFGPSSSLSTHGASLSSSRRSNLHLLDFACGSIQQSTALKLLYIIIFSEFIRETRKPEPTIDGR